jgi:hypothetical protein
VVSAVPARLGLRRLRLSQTLGQAKALNLGLALAFICKMHFFRYRSVSIQDVEIY